MSQLILLRHGQSMWNRDNLFTGWVDVPLSKDGIQEALKAGTQLSSTNIDVIYTSTLMRAQQTAMLAMSEHASAKVPILLHHEPDMAQRFQIHSEKAAENMIPVHASWHLNERNYGHLQGANKAETIEQYGKEKVHMWRRSFDVPPPEGESLAMTRERTIPYFEQNIMPHLENNETVLIAAHGNSLRSIVMQLENLSTEDVLKLELATGVPRIYQYENGTFKRK